MKVDSCQYYYNLLGKKRIGARELSRYLKFSPRTIYRDIDAINWAGIPVRSSPEWRRFEIMPEYKIKKGFFGRRPLRL